MLNQPTTDKLNALRLHGMRAAWEEQHTKVQSSELGFDERFGLLVEAEHLYRDNVRLTRLLREAKLKLSQACVEDIEYSARRELDRAVIRQLATCRWVREHHNVLISGPTGAGKSYVACALAQQACRTSSSSPTPTAPTRVCSPASSASTSWSSTTGGPA
jgi:DNA replication protein DnaC